MFMKKSESKNQQVEAYVLQAKELVSKMTLEEKVFQMLHQAPAIERLGVKSYNWWNEGLHGVARAGVATVFPQAIGLAAAFDEDMMETVGDAISTEARAKFNMQQKFGDTDIYKGLTMWAPNVNIFRDPRWGRGHETYGEDPYLTSRLGVRFVEGLQGHNDKYMKVAACAKHFAVHSGPEAMRHYFNAEASEHDMRDTYLPAFQALVEEANVETVMGAYNRTNGEPCCGSKPLLKDILRDEWGFEGHVVSDCWAVKDFHEAHCVTKTPVESVAKAVNSGCDLNCGNIFFYLKDAVEQGLVEESRIDEAVTRLFTTRMKLGLFATEDDNEYDKIPYSVVDSKEMRDLNLEVAKKCLVLLKNQDHLLPLDRSKIKTVGVIGPNANNRRALVGNYEGTSSRYVTVLEGIQDYLGEDVRVLTSEGCKLSDAKVEPLAMDRDRIAEVKGVCDESDVVVVCVGLDASLEGEEGDTGNSYASGDKIDLNLPGLQEEVIETAYASGKPVILVILAGSALAVNWADEHVPAIIQAWYPGAQGGAAIAELIFGEYSPEGKLPVTFYRTVEELPEFTDYSMKNRTYRYMKQEALYPFGFGLSYTNYEYSNPSVTETFLAESGVEVTFDVKNTGSYDGRETVQVYVKLEEEDTPNAQLKLFKKIALKQKESKTVSIRLPLSAFAIVNEEGKKEIHKGTYSIYISGAQPDKRSIHLTGVTPISIKVNSNICKEL